MKIINRYILKESLSLFLICLLAFIGILLTARILKFANLVVNRGVELGQIIMVFLSIIPTFLEIAVPMATLLGVMLTFARLSGDSEIVVMRSSGISLKQLIKPVALIGISACFLGFVVSHLLRPWGYRELSLVLFDIARSKSTSGLSEGVFNKLGSLTLYAEKIDFTTGGLERVLIDDKRETGVRKVITSQTGEILSDSEKRTITLKLRDGKIHETIGEKYILTSFDSNSLLLDPDELYGANQTREGKDFQELSIFQIAAREKIYQERLAQVVLEKTKSKIATPDTPAAALTALQKLNDRQLKTRIRDLQVERGRRFSMPFAALVLALVALPLGIQPPRSQKTWGAGLSVILGLSVFVLYYGALSIGLALGQAGVLPITLALWAPNLIAGTVAFILLKNMGSERWQSVTHLLESIVLRITDKYRSYRQR